MLKMKLQYFGHLMQRTNSLENTLMLGEIEGRRRRGRQRMKWLDKHHLFKARESEQSLGDGEGQESLKCCSPWRCKELDVTEQQQTYLTVRTSERPLLRPGDIATGQVPAPPWCPDPEVRDGNPLQYSCLKNLMDRGAWCATVHGVSKSQIRLGTHARQKTSVSFGEDTNQVIDSLFLPFLSSREAFIFL